MALAIAGGGEFLGWKAGKKRVLIVDGEMDLQDLRDRIKGLLPGIPGIDEAAAGRNIAILARQRNLRELAGFFPIFALSKMAEETTASEVRERNLEFGIPTTQQRTSIGQIQ